MNKHIMKTAFITLIIFLLVFFCNRPDMTDKKMFTVALIPQDGMTILSENPVTVNEGESAGFEVVFSDGYSVGNNTEVRYENGSLWIDDVRSSRSVLFIPAKQCVLSVTDTDREYIELVNGYQAFSGDEVSVRIMEREHYSCENLWVNDNVYPIPAGKEMDFPVYDDSVLKVEWKGEPMSVSVVSAIGDGFRISGLREEYCYGDTLSLRAEYDAESVMFNGWSTENYLSSGGTALSSDDELTLTITQDIEVFANFGNLQASYTLRIDPNGGKISEPIVFENMIPGQPAELPADNIGLTRDGHTLVGYNTRADGEGAHYALSAPINMPVGDITLFAEWIQNTPEELLTYVIKDKTAVVTGRKGDIGGVLCIPSRIKGAPVRSIEGNAFRSDATLETVVLPIGVAYVYENAFSDCPNLETVYLPDTIKGIRDGAFSGTEKLSRMHVLASTDARAYDRTFNAAYADRYQRLTTTEGKRLILVAGSSGSFGLNSEMLAEHYPDYTVINFSGSYQFGMRPVSYYLMNNVHPGDVIVFAPEYYDGMYANELSGEIANWMYLESNYNMLGELDLGEVRKSILDTFAGFLNERRKLLPGKDKARNVLARANFNIYGDICVERAHRANTEPYKPPLNLINDRGVKWLTGVFEDIASKGGVCLFSFPPVSDGNSTKKNLAPAYEQYTQKLITAYENAAVTVISNAADYIFPEDLFYDNRYHMTMEGAEKRTEQLIRDLDAFGIGR